MTEEKKFSDPELEKFFNENREFIERILKEEKKQAKSRVISEIKKAEHQKDKAKENVEGFIEAFTDPEVQKHFMMAGFELLLGVTALVKATPMPEVFKEAMDKSEEAKKDVMKTYATMADEPAEEKPSKPQKIEIKKTAPKTTKKTDAE